MTPQEFKRLSLYSAAQRYAPKPSKPIVSRFAAKRMGRRAHGRVMVPLERVFNHPSFDK